MEDAQVGAARSKIGNPTVSLSHLKIFLRAAPRRYDVDGLADPASLAPLPIMLQ
jgi:hypothetical protein